MKKFQWIAALAAVCVVALALIGWRAQQPAASAPPPPTVDTTALLREAAPSLGRAEAPVVIVEFFDPACGTCRTFYPLVKQLMAQHPERIRLVLRYAPFHPGSDKVVALLEAAHRQGKFWPTLEALFAHQDDWVVNHTAKLERTWAHLQDTGLNLEQVAFDMTAPELQAVVARDLADANRLGVSQTPEYFVNGRPLPSFGFEQLQQLVAEALARAP